MIFTPCFDGLISELPCIEDVSVSPPIWNGWLQHSYNQLYCHDNKVNGPFEWDHDRSVQKFSTNVKNLDNDDDVCVICSFTLLSCLMDELKKRKRMSPNLSEEEVCRSILQESVEFHPKIIEQRDAFKNQKLSSARIIGVHHRKTDEAATNRALPTDEQYLQASEKALSQAGPGALLFLATDNAAVQEMYQKRFGRDNVVWRDKWLPAAGESIHMNSSCPDGIQSAYDAMTDIALLSSCDFLVLTHNSSFSRIVSYFTDIKHIHWIHPLQRSLKNMVLKKMAYILSHVRL